MSKKGALYIVFVLDYLLVVQSQPSGQCSDKSGIGHGSVSPRYPFSGEGDNGVPLPNFWRHSEWQLDRVLLVHSRTRHEKRDS